MTANSLYFVFASAVVCHSVPILPGRATDSTTCGASEMCAKAVTWAMEIGVTRFGGMFEDLLPSDSFSEFHQRLYESEFVDKKMVVQCPLPPCAQDEEQEDEEDNDGMPEDEVPEIPDDEDDDTSNEVNGEEADSEGSDPDAYSIHEAYFTASQPDYYGKQGGESSHSWQGYFSDPPLGHSAARPTSDMPENIAEFVPSRRNVVDQGVHPWAAIGGRASTYWACLLAGCVAAIGGVVLLLTAQELDRKAADPYMSV